METNITKVLGYAASFGLEHAWIHQRIANDHVSRKEWEEAEIQSAAWRRPKLVGLGTKLGISTVYEGLGNWAEWRSGFEKQLPIIHRVRGTDWYMWCRRTGRGNVSEARQVSRTYHDS